MRCVSGSMSKRCHCPCSKRRSARGSEYLVKEDTEVKFAGENPPFCMQNFPLVPNI